MSPVDGLTRAWRWSVRKILGLWVKVTIRPDDAAVGFAARARPVCYVLEHDSQTDLAVLNNACAELQLPRPERRLAATDRRLDKAYFELTDAGRFWSARSRLRAPRMRAPRMRAPRYLVQLVAAADADPNFDIDLVPVAIFWVAHR